MSSFRDKNRWGYLIPQESQENIYFSKFEEKIRIKGSKDNAWKDVCAKWEKVSSIYQATEQNSKSNINLSLHDVIDMDKKLSAWFESRSVSSFMPYPPSDKDFIKALANTINQDVFNRQNILQNEVSLLFLKMCPTAFISSLNIVKQYNIKNDNVINDVDFLVSCFSQEVKKDKDVSSDNNTSKTTKTNTASKANKTDQVFLTETIKGWLKEIETQKEKHQSPLAVLQSTLNGLIKESVVKHKGIHDNSLNYWFEDLALPAILSLDIDDMQKISLMWPENSIATFVSPSKTMDSGTFLRNMVGIRNPERSYLTQNLLPKLVNGTSWSLKERVAMLDSMIERTKEHPWLFKERLLLWKSWGGDLKSMVPSDDKNDNSSLFKPKEMITIEEKLRQQNIEGWNDVLDEVLKSSPENQPSPSKVKIK